MELQDEIARLLALARADLPDAEWPDRGPAAEMLDLPRGRPSNWVAMRQAEEARQAAIERLSALGLSIAEIWPGCRVRRAPLPVARGRVRISPEEQERLLKSPPW